MLSAFTLSSPVPSFPGKVNRGHPSSVKNKHHNTTPAFLSAELALFVLSLSLSFPRSFFLSLPVSRSAHPQFVPSVQIMRLLVGLHGDPNQHERVRAVRTYKGESPEEVADPLVTLSPRGVAAALAVCVSVQSVEQMAGVLGREQQVSACMSPG